MPRCNLTLRQKCQIIELSSEQSTEEIAKKFHVHPTTVTRTLKKKKKILEQAARVNVNFKTVQTNKRGEEHDTMILEFIKSRQDANEPLSIQEICDKAMDYAKTLNRPIKSKRGWWRRFKLRCNIVKSKLQKRPAYIVDSVSEKEHTPIEKSSKKYPNIKSSERNKSFTFKIRESKFVVHKVPGALIMTREIS